MLERDKHIGKLRAVLAAKAEQGIACYSEHLVNTCTPEILAAELGLADTPPRESRPGGCYEARIELPDSYSRLIFMWTDDGSNGGYAWELATPASNNVSWAKHLADTQ